MKQIISISIIISILIVLLSCQNNIENEVLVLPVERIIYNNPAPIPTMNGTISFLPGANTPEDATYRMYFDSSEDPQTVFDLAIPEKKYTNLNINHTYYWRVETISSNGQVLASSPIWSFTTSNTFIIRTQEDIELLGSNNYTKIMGTLIIGDFVGINQILPESTNIKNLAPLIKLKEVIKLVVNNNDLLENLDGISNLEIIHDDLFIGVGQNSEGGNSQLKDISALSKVNSIGGSLIIYNNNELTNLNGLESILTINNDLIIENNSKLKDLCALTTLFKNSEPSGLYQVVNNGYNPSKMDLMNENCTE
ncbi:hypothetical protein [Tenacibaculum sp. 190524A05c]|uniref:hypothetical protein n=1 Tax=Tenacibaculum platacis TaxID=3137852 RepID=UPI0032B1D810